MMWRNWLRNPALGTSDKHYIVSRNFPPYDKLLDRKGSTTRPTFPEIHYSATMPHNKMIEQYPVIPGQSVEWPAEYRD